MMHIPNGYMSPLKNSKNRAKKRGYAFRPVSVNQDSRPNSVAIGDAPRFLLCHGQPEIYGAPSACPPPETASPDGGFPANRPPICHRWPDLHLRIRHQPRSEVVIDSFFEPIVMHRAASSFLAIVRTQHSSEKQPTIYLGGRRLSSRTHCMVGVAFSH